LHAQRYLGAEAVFGAANVDVALAARAGQPLTAARGELKGYTGAMPRLWASSIRALRFVLFACAVALWLGLPGVARADGWLGPDKALHLGVSAGLSAGGYAAASACFERPAVRFALGVGVGVAAGAGKELYDMGGHGDPSWRDFTWDVIGALTGATIALLVDRLVSGGSTDKPHSAAR
jgi:putative lipoprotein